MQALTFFFAFVAVLALIGVAAWLVRQFAGNRLGANTNRGRMPRLAVIDAAAVDGRRRLVLVRRDNVEHLLMIGGPTDIVVEPNIVRAMPGRDQIAAAGRRRQPSRCPASRRCPMPATGPTATAHVRHVRSRRTADAGAAAAPGARPSFADEVRRPAPPERRSERSRSPDRLHAGAARRPSGAAPRIARRADAVAGDLAQRAGDAAAAVDGRANAPKPPPVRAERPAAPPRRRRSRHCRAADQNLAEMAQRLEAALRRPAGDAAEPRVGAPPVAPEPPPARAPAASRRWRRRLAAPAKSGFENLEDEMASLLGRPKTPS